MLELKHTLPADKSVFQRGLLFSLLCDKPCVLRGALGGKDSKSALEFVRLFAKVRVDEDCVYISEQRFLEFKTPFKSKRKIRFLASKPRSAKALKPKQASKKSFFKALATFEKDKSIASFNCQNSGTLLRLGLGLLAGSSKRLVLDGDLSLKSRPMRRILKPLAKLGAKTSLKNAPILVQGTRLNHAKFITPLSSAQLKSAFILASLQGRKKSSFKESFLSRDHSEQMLKSMGASIVRKAKWLHITPLKAPLSPLNLSIPKDPSAAFFIVLAGLIYKSVCVRGVLFNKTRLEGINILLQMGAKVKVVRTSKSLCDIYSSPSKLRGVRVHENIPWLIDELPALAIAFALASSPSVLTNAAELRVKESDRLKSMVLGLQKCGVKAFELKDGLKVEPATIHPAKINCFKDHRVAMSFMLLAAKFGVSVDDEDCVESSFENFKLILSELTS